MAQTLGDLPVGAKVKAIDSKFYGKDLIFRVLGAGHSQDPADSVILQTNDIITARCFDARESNNSNSDRNDGGNSRYLYANLLQWLNSDAGMGEWYTPKHEADQAPNSVYVLQESGTAVNPYDTQAGFMNEFTANFKNSLLTVAKRTGKITTDGGGYEDVQSKFFLLSTTEVGLADKNNVAEGSIYSLFNIDSSKRVMVPTIECANNSVGFTINAGEVWYWWLRTPYSGYSCAVYYVTGQGGLGSAEAYDGIRGVAPACAISKDQKVSDTVDSDGCYTLIYEKSKIDKPTMSTASYKVTKSEITPKLDGYDSSTMTLSGDTSATSIGFYTLSVTPKDSYIWSDDSSVDPISFAWDIYDVGVIKRNHIVYGDTSELENRIAKMLNGLNSNIAKIANIEKIILNSTALKFSSDDDFTLSANPNWNGIIEYSIDDGKTWNIWDGSQLNGDENNNIYLRGSNNTRISNYTINNFQFTGKYCTGNIETLLDYQTVINGYHPKMSYNCYYYMFHNCTSLVEAPELPATTLVNSCYSNMFNGCTSLIKVPELPATILANYCYNDMFSGCTSLTKGPELHATTLAKSCYQDMFRGCTSLVETPELPAITLADSCYEFMFKECTSLVKAPKLPAITLTDSCYYQMFQGCTSLKLSTTQTGEYNKPYRIPTSGTGATASDALTDMFKYTGGTFKGTPTINTTYYIAN